MYTSEHSYYVLLFVIIYSTLAAYTQYEHIARANEPVGDANTIS